MRTALGKMQMSSTEFWNMSFAELYAAFEGFSEFHSGGKPPPLSKGELEGLMEIYPD